MSFEEFFRQAREHEEYWVEDAILAFTTELNARMKEQGISKSELARRIGASQPYVTKVLKGSENLTIATMVKLARATGARVRIALEEPPQEESRQSVRQPAAKADSRRTRSSGPRQPVHPPLP